MVQRIEGQLNAGGCSFALIVSRFNSMITQQLELGALDMLKRHGAEEKNLTVIKVPGGFEIPAAARAAAASGKFDAVIALGAVIRGGTPHFDYIAAEVTKGVAQVSLEFAVPVVMGVLTCDTIEQAIDRAGAKSGNKGADAALSAIEMVQIYRQLQPAAKGASAGRRK